MSFTYGFYNSVNHDRVYDAQQWSSIFDGLIADGIYETQGDKFIVSATDPASMIVTVGTGRAWFHHTWSLNDSLLPLTLDNSDLVVPRIDVICLETNTNAEVRANAIKILKGIPAANPVAPTLTHSEFVNQYALAEIYIPAGATSITQANITNKVGTTGTPFVIGIIDIMDASDLYAQWQGQWEVWLAQFNGVLEEYEEYAHEKEAEMSAWLSGFEQSSDAQFRAWFTHLRNELDSNQAAHLQNQIDALTEDVFFNYYNLTPTTTNFIRTGGTVTGVNSVNAKSTVSTVFNKDSSGNISTIVTTIVPTEGLFNYIKTATFNGDTITTTYTREVKN